MYHRPWMRAVSSFLTVIVIAGALYSGWFFFATVRMLVAQTPLPFGERVAQAAERPPLADNNPSAPGPTENTPQTAPSLDSRRLTEPINVLLLGIDEREGESGPWRSDTMILVSLDPVNNTAAMLSIPRDLWTTIPGYGESRINTAHFTGESHNYPGGGPALAKKTVWFAFGVPVHYYVRINFGGFEQIIDAIGGVTIDVPEAIRDTRYPTADFGVTEIYIPAGVQHMDGRAALQYARTRRGATDYTRMERQQQLLLAIRDKVLALDIPLSSIPTLVGLVGTSVSTDLTLADMVLLAEAARDVPQESIRYAVLDNSMTTTVVTPQGWMVEVADWDKVRALVDELFPAP